ncbi:MULTISPECIES: hypothetical protein [Clostridium]|uniref:Uncharacterized protein n=1 Tax=Clostridium faecium TaxID=2762223 RepID=A0ABR8YS76_9CLOT|nr:MULTISPECIES: hypothetical protein [Clostridium]MBD8047107.1 hypothetical protein [Clostridium faecium]MDU1348391.1 hypothetical protein [Clostridium argentinense]
MKNVPEAKRVSLNSNTKKELDKFKQEFSQDISESPKQCGCNKNKKK